MPELLATCWTHAGAIPLPGQDLSPYDIRTRAEAAARAGYTGIGFTIEDLDAARPTFPLADIKILLNDLGLVHAEVELLGDWWAEGERRRRSDIKRAKLLDAAAALGARQIKIGPDVAIAPSSAPAPVDRDRWAAELHDLAEQAANAGTRVALEVLPMSNLPDFLETAELIAASDHPAAGLAVDIWHVERGPSTLADLARLPAEMVFAVELNDALAEPVGDLYTDTIRNRVQVGEGAFDVKGFIGALQSLGFSGPWGVEILSDAHRKLPLDEAMSISYQSVLRQFDEVEWPLT